MTLIFQRTLNPTCRLALLLLCLLVYMCVCAVVFSTLEKHNDHEQFLYYHDLKLNYKQKYNMSEEEFIQFTRDASVLYKRGYVGEYMNYWNFYHSFWFTTTVVTTMGFGHVVPLTFEGRLFCILCALLGIPLNAVVLKTVGERINGFICNTIKYIEIMFNGRRDPTHVGIKATIVSFILMVVFLLVGGALDTIFDGWTFFDGVYFNFIALSTIGFGDLFPRVETATKLDQLGFGESGKRFFVSFIMLSFMIMGLAVVSTVVCSLLNTLEEMSQVPWTTSTSSFDHKGPVELKSIKPEKNGKQMPCFQEENKDNATNQINAASDG